MGVLGSLWLLLFSLPAGCPMGNLIFLWAFKACMVHDVVVKWKHFPCYSPFVRGIHQSLVNSPHKVLWLGTLMFSLICAWTNSWVNNRYASDLRHHHAHCDFTVMPGPHVRMRLDLEMQFITIWMYSLYFMSLKCNYCYAIQDRSTIMKFYHFS